MTRSVAYLVSRWGEPTQTFVRREAEGLRAAGVDVSAWSLKRPRPTTSTIPVRHLGAGRVLLVAAGQLLRSPRSNLPLLVAVLTRSRPRNLPAQLYAALAGIALARGDARAGWIHAHFGWVAATGAWAAAGSSGRPFSVVLHAFELHVERLQDRFTEVPLRAATRVFTISERDAGAVRRRHGVDASVLRMAVPDSWLQHRDSPPRRAGLVVSVGSLLPKKGHDLLLRALADLPPAVEVEIAGDGPELSNLRSLASELGVAHRVTFLGHCDEGSIRALLDRAACFALACREAPDGDRDGIPVALMEAMAAGLPVVAGDAGAVAELVAGVGLLVAPDDPAALSSALRIALDPTRSAELGRLGRRRIEDGWTVSATTRGLLGALQEPVER